jgi:hypothetical protein
MTALGIALIVAGLTLVCGSMIFRLFTGSDPSASQESFEESLERLDSRLRGAQRKRTSQDLDDKSERTDDVLDNRQHRDEQHAHDRAAPMRIRRAAR